MSLNTCISRCSHNSQNSRIPWYGCIPRCSCILRMRRLRCWGCPGLVRLALVKARFSLKGQAWKGPFSRFKVHDHVNLCDAQVTLQQSPVAYRCQHRLHSPGARATQGPSGPSLLAFATESPISLALRPKGPQGDSGQYKGVWGVGRWDLH